MTPEQIKEGISRFPFWYHKIDLNGIVTPGRMPHSFDAYRFPESFEWKRVLDIGAFDGFYTFEALKRGAKEVVAIDDWSDMPGLDSSPRTEWDTFDFCKEVFGYTDEHCKRYTMKVYDIEYLGKFDVVLFYGVFYHLRHPLLALDKIASVCAGDLYIESAICNDYSPYKSGGYEYDNNIVMEFYPGDEYACNPTNWWNPTLSCLCQMVKSVGFSNIKAWKFDRPEQKSLCRGFVKGCKDADKNA